MIYRLKTISGSGAEGVEFVELEDPSEAEAYARNAGLELIEARLDLLHSLFRQDKKHKPKRQALIDFFSYMSSLMGMGLDMTSALATAADSLTDKALKDGIEEIRGHIENGYSLSQGMVEVGIFPQMAIASVRAAEVAGRLEEVLEELASHYRDLKAMVDNAKKAAMYPVISVAVLSAIISMLLIVVVPQLKTLFPPHVPLPTRIMIAMSDFLLGYWWTLPLVPVGVIVAKRSFPASWKDSATAVYYRLPIAGRLAKELALANLFMSLAMLTGGGVAILQALQTVSESATSELLNRKLREVREHVMLGMGLGDAFSDPFFPTLVCKAVRQGELTGRLDSYFSKLAGFLKGKVNAQVTFLSTFIEPIITVIGGGMVMMISLAIFLPIYGQLGKLGK